MQNKIYRAFEEYENLIHTRPDYVPGYIQLGLLCIQLGVVSRGIEILQIGLSKKPTLKQRFFIHFQIFRQRKRMHAHKKYKRPRTAH